MIALSFAFLRALILKKLSKTVNTIAIVAEITNKDEESKADCRGKDIDALEEVLKA